jgi:hypothetical protein
VVGDETEVVPDHRYPAVLACLAGDLEALVLDLTG